MKELNYIPPHFRDLEVFTLSCSQDIKIPNWRSFFRCKLKDLPEKRTFSMSKQAWGYAYVANNWLFFDCDGITPEHFVLIKRAVKLSNNAFIYTTVSSTEEKPRFRLAIYDEAQEDNTTVCLYRVACKLKTLLPSALFDLPKLKQTALFLAPVGNSEITWGEGPAPFYEVLTAFAAMRAVVAIEKRPAVDDWLKLGHCLKALMWAHLGRSTFVDLSERFRNERDANTDFGVVFDKLEGGSRLGLRWLYDYAGLHYVETLKPLTERSLDKQLRFLIERHGADAVLSGLNSIVK